MYVVFMSDGEPNEGFGTAQAAELMNVHNATIYTVGIQLTGSAPDALKNISTYVNGQPLYQNVTNMSDLAPVLNAIAEDIKLAGTAAVFKDFISEYFEYYNVAPYNTGDGTYDPILEVVTISVGNINKVPDTYKIYVQLKAEYWLEDQIYPTNEDIHLDYIDVDGEPAHKDKFEIGHPDLSVGFGTITVKYVLVNEVGQYIDSETGVLVDYAFRDFVPAGYSHLFEYGGSTSLEVEQTYTVTPSVPAGYTLYQPGETITQEVSWDNTNPTVEFKVVRIDTVDITVTKTWIGTPGTITIDLYANGVLHDSKDLTGEGTVTFDNLPKFDSNGEISYTVTETTSDGTQLSAGGNAGDGFTFTNVSNEKVEFTVNKEWLGPVGESATVKLIDGETEVDSVELNAENNWIGTLKGPKYDEEGNEIEYAIVEEEIDNYDSEVVDNENGSFTIINTNNETVDIYVYKYWDDNGEEQQLELFSTEEGVKPTITFRLWVGDTEIDSITLENGELEGVFKDKPVYDLEGNRINYAITEDSIPGYAADIYGPFEDGDLYVEIINTIQKFNVYYNANGGSGTMNDENNPYKYNSSVTVLANTFTRSNYRFIGWNTAANGSGTSYAVGATFTMPAHDVTLYAQWQSGGGGGGGGGGGTIIEEPEVPLAELEKFDHFAYIIGYPEGDIRPLNNITREEVAMIFYRLLTDESRNQLLSDVNPFTDVEGNRWSNRAISTLYNAGIISGYPDGTFRPSAPITRAEFATIAAKFDNLDLGIPSKFTDIAGHWAERYITSAENKGWVQGYPDMTFKPEQDITRAEAMTLINNVLERAVPKENIHPDAIFWPDISEGDWYYEIVMEATNSHDYTIEEDGDELWTGLKPNKVWP